MNQICETILHRFIIRHKEKQKAAFREFIIESLKEKNIEAKIQTASTLGIKSHNIVIGNIDEAENILCAHYDTPNTMLIPYIVSIDNFFITLAISILGLFPIFIVWMLIIKAIGTFITGILPFLILSEISMLILFYLFYLCFTNKNNYNDNTSGVVAVMEILLSLSETERKNTLFILFDNEEKGLLGSMGFSQSLGKKFKGTVFNFDCIGDGSHIVALAKKSAYKAHQTLSSYFSIKYEHTFILKKRTWKTILFMSDDANFNNSICFAAFKKKPFIGRYVDKIHTNMDKKLNQNNIVFITTAIIAYIKKPSSKNS